MMTTTYATTTPAPAAAPAAPAATTPTAAAPRVRMPLWDNARFVAIALVIAGHAILPLISNSNPAYAVYLFIYLFHVPLFVAISGYFASAARPTASDARKLLRQLIAPYLIFETIWTGIHWALSGTLSLDYATAWWTLWFLMALVIWRLVLPLLVVLRYPLTISIALSVGAGYLGGLDDRFALARTVGLLPFFVLGWKLKQADVGARWLALAPATVLRLRVAAFALLAGTAVGSFVGIDLWRDLLVRRFLLYDEDYSSFGYEQWWAGAVRLLAIGFAMLLCIAVLMLAPRGTTVLTSLGQATLYIYLLHSFVLYPIRQAPWFDGNSSGWMLAAALALALALPFVLGSGPVKRLVRPLVEPRLDWLLSRPAPALPGSTTARQTRAGGLPR